MCVVIDIVPLIERLRSLAELEKVERNVSARRTAGNSEMESLLEDQLPPVAWYSDIPRD